MLPLRDAIARLSAKTPVGSILRSAEWETVPLALRERAQFSAGVTSIRLLQSIQDRLLAQIQLQREKLAAGKQATFDRSSFIDAIRDIARNEGLSPADDTQRGGLQDITSIPRLGLIYDMQRSMAAGFAAWKLDQNEGALAIFPAWRFGPSSARVPRTTWEARWREAGSKVGWRGALQSPMVALKTSPIWAALSRFGTPWPPFDWGSTRELEDVDRDEAESLGLLRPGEVPPPTGEADFNQNLQASLSGISPQLRDALQSAFGDQISFDGDTARWTGRSAPQIPAAPIPPPPSQGRDQLSARLFNDQVQLHSDQPVTPASVARAARITGAPDGSTIFESHATAGNIQRTLWRIENDIFMSSSWRELIVLENGQKELHNIVLELTEPQQGKGIGARIFARQARQAQEEGVIRIRCTAMRGTLHNGYYTWPRLGCDAALPSDLIARLPMQLRSATTILDLMATDEGRQWWRLNGDTMSMTFDLRAGSRSWQVLNDYLAQHGINL